MKKLFYYISVLGLLVLTSCGGATIIKPDKDEVKFTIDGGEQNVNISADGNWDIRDCPEWVTTELQDSVLIIKTAKNETGAIREGNIVITGKEGVEAIIKVIQATKCTHITPDSDKVNFDKEGGTQTVKIDTDGIPQVETPEGFTATYASGLLTITTPSNEENSKNGEIKLTCDDQIAIIAVSQEGNVCPKCNGSGKIKCSKCGGQGYYFIDFVKEDYGCKKCGGKGSRHLLMGSDLGWNGNDGGYEDCGFRKGSGKMNCPTCGGTGHL